MRSLPAKQTSQARNISCKHHTDDDVLRQNNLKTYHSNNSEKDQTHSLHVCFCVSGKAWVATKRAKWQCCSETSTTFSNRPVDVSTAEALPQFIGANRTVPWKCGQSPLGKLFFTLWLVTPSIGFKRGHVFDKSWTCKQQNKMRSREQTWQWEQSCQLVYSFHQRCRAGVFGESSFRSSKPAFYFDSRLNKTTHCPK